MRELFFIKTNKTELFVGKVHEGLSELRWFHYEVNGKTREFWLRSYYVCFCFV
jgi:hypothetical protein